MIVRIIKVDRRKSELVMVFITGAKSNPAS